MRSDSKAALGMMLKLASHSRILNAVGREIAYDTALGDYRVELSEHTPRVSNVSPDYLSRVHAPLLEGGDRKREPPALIGVPRLKVPVRDAKFWRTWTSPADPEGALGEG